MWKQHPGLQTGLQLPEPWFLHLQMAVRRFTLHSSDCEIRKRNDYRKWTNGNRTVLVNRNRRTTDMSLICDFKLKNNKEAGESKFNNLFWPISKILSFLHINQYKNDKIKKILFLLCCLWSDMYFIHTALFLKTSHLSRGQQPEVAAGDLTEQYSYVLIPHIFY